MATASFTKYQCFCQDIGDGLHDLNSDVLKFALTNTAPNAGTHKVLSDIAEIGAGDGYTAGGVTVPNTAYSQAGGTATLTGDAATFTASGGTIGPFRYVVLYNSTSSTKPLIAYFDYGSSGSFDTLAVEPNGQSTGGTLLTVS